MGGHETASRVTRRVRGLTLAAATASVLATAALAAPPVGATCSFVAEDYWPSEWNVSKTDIEYLNTCTMQFSAQFWEPYPKDVTEIAIEAAHYALEHTQPTNISWVGGNAGGYDKFGLK
jgi:hypothetical protein